MKCLSFSNSLQESDHKHLLHPWLSWNDEIKDNLIIESAKGSYVTDIAGKRYLDTTGGLWTVNIGYGREDMAEAISKQVTMLNHFPIFGNVATKPSVELAQKLSDLAPKEVNKVFFTTTGSSSNDTAIRMAHHYHVMRGNCSKKHIITRDAGYHGMTYLGASVSGQPPVYKGAFHYERQLVHRVSSPSVYHRPIGMTLEEFADSLVEEFERKIQEIGPENIACFINEPIVGAGGVFEPPPSYTQRIYNICSENDIVTIADEVITAFGRVGAMFASPEIFGVTPDITCLAKGITSGYQPLGAVMISDKIYDAVSYSSNSSPFAHGFTYTGHAVACAAALKNISILENERILENVKALSPYFIKKVESLKDGPLVGGTRGIGFMIAVELVQDKSNKTPFPAEAMIKEKLTHEALNLGLLIRPLNNCILISPPLILKSFEIDTIVDSLRICLRKVAEQLHNEGFKIE